FALLLDRLLDLGKPLLLVGSATLAVAAAGIAALPFRAVARRRRLLLQGVAWGVALGILHTAALLTLGAPMGHAIGAIAVSLLVVGAAYGLALGWSLDVLTPSDDATTSIPLRAPAFSSGRRSLVLQGLASLGALALAGGLGSAIANLPRATRVSSEPDRRADESASPAGSPDTRADGLPEGVTPTDRFYVVSKNVRDPVVDPASWALSVEGWVERPFRLTIEALEQLPQVERYLTLACISNPVGGDLIGTALWRGVPLRTLLERAGVKTGARYVQFTSVDDYTEQLPLEQALDPETLVATRMNGEPLPPKHGFPARVVMPGRYGMKNPKWLRRILVSPDSLLGYWEQQGWSDEAIVKTTSRIDRPRDGDAFYPGVVTVAGIAYAGDRGIGAVEISADGGQTWQPAVVERPLGPATWTLWWSEWTPPGPGRYALTVRATDGAGAVQIAERSGSFPDGATGLDSIAVHIVNP
ncbi:MAG TPA: molybdopterin-dependent oxidoreductase, partial [Chloroflexota bacterium]